MNVGYSTPEADLPIDAVCPVNWQHPLNRGLVSWHLALPGWVGGGKFPNLCNPQHHGALTSMDPVTDWVSAKGRRGGWFALDFDRVNDAVDTATGPITITNAVGALACWCRLTDVSVVQKFLGTGDGTSGFALVADGAAWASHHSEISASVGTRWGTAESGVWTHVIGSFDTVGANTTLTFAINGVPRASTGSTGGISIGVSNRLRMGARNDTWQLGLLGQLDDVRVYNRMIPDSEALLLYNSSCLGHPGALRRVSMSQSYEAGGAPPPSGVVDPMGALGFFGVAA